MMSNFIKNAYSKIKKVFFNGKSSNSRNILFTIGFLCAFAISIYCLVNAVTDFRSAIYLCVGLLLIYVIHTLLMVCVFVDDEPKDDESVSIDQLLANPTEYKLTANQIRTLEVIKKKVK